MLSDWIKYQQIRYPCGLYKGVDVYKVMRHGEKRLMEAKTLAKTFQNESAERGERIQELINKLARADVEIYALQQEREDDARTMAD